MENHVKEAIQKGIELAQAADDAIESALSCPSIIDSPTETQDILSRAQLELVILRELLDELIYHERLGLKF